MSYKRFKLKEDAPANNVGAGNIAGVGVGAQGEPGVNKKLVPRVKRILKRKNFKEDLYVRKY